VIEEPLRGSDMDEEVVRIYSSPPNDKLEREEEVDCWYLHILGSTL